MTTKRVPFRWVAEELFWFLSGSTDDAELQARGVDIWAGMGDRRADRAIRPRRRAISVRSTVICGVRSAAIIRR